ncbi:hypothetical protein [Streptomyces sp. MBT62]|uniref:hypothetical protein n=1 Tax=Streptomyces sp. MBT62 TaxID=2800410 RepID=UPI0019092B6A|nr:hypothetical protein [Streptomyces sp. MBT62]MBK3568653.1 hypothetical protein [Streptomyces sp. MBT62]
MSAGQAVRSSLRSGRVRLALGVTVAATALAVGSTLTAHADTARPAPQKSGSVVVPPCENPDPSPVEAVPGGKFHLPKHLPQKSLHVILGDCGPDTPSVGDPVEATPVPGSK